MLQAKLDTYHSLREMTGFDKSNIEVFESCKHFRMRANFSIWRDERYNNDPKGMYYAMFDMTMVDEETGRVMKRPGSRTFLGLGIDQHDDETLMVLWQDKEGKHADMSKAPG